MRVTYLQKQRTASGSGGRLSWSRPLATENGNLKAVLGLLIFSVFSFFLSFGIVWVAIMGWQNPLGTPEEEKTLEELARADSLRAVEMALAQEITAMEKRYAQLQNASDSLKKEIDSRSGMIKQLEQEIALLEGKTAGLEEERIKALSGIVAGLSKENLKQFTENTDLNLLVEILLRASPRKARDILDAMEPRKAARVAEKMARVKRNKG